MKILIVEDDFVGRKLLQKLLGPYGECDLAFDGVEAVEACRLALQDGAQYDLICMDIMMPNKDGQEALKEIRQLEQEMLKGKGGEAKVIMVTALSDPKNVVEALYRGGAESYIVKPVTKDKLQEELKKLKLI